VELASALPLLIAHPPILSARVFSMPRPRLSCTFQLPFHSCGASHPARPRSDRHDFSSEERPDDGVLGLSSCTRSPSALTPPHPLTPPMPVHSSTALWLRSPSSPCRLIPTPLSSPPTPPRGQRTWPCVPPQQRTLQVYPLSLSGRSVKSGGSVIGDPSNDKSARLLNSAGNQEGAVKAKSDTRAKDKGAAKGSGKRTAGAHTAPRAPIGLWGSKKLR